MHDRHPSKPGRERPTLEERQAEGGQIEKPRLTTSAMIASLAAEGQPTKSAPFGHALAALAETRPEIVGLTADLSKYTDLYVSPRPTRSLLPDGDGGAAADERRRRDGAKASPFATTYAVFASGEPTTSSVLRSPRRT